MRGFGVLSFEVQGEGFRVLVLAVPGFEVRGEGIRVRGEGFRVRGFGY